MMTRTSYLLTLGVCAALAAAACSDAPTSPATVSEGPDPFEQTSAQSQSAIPSSLVSTGAIESASPVGCDHPVIAYVSGSCAAGPSAAPTHAAIMGTCFTPNKEAALVMSANTNGFIKGGTLCNGAVLEVGEPFVLPPTFLKTDALGSASATMTLQSGACFVEALDLTSCKTTNVATPE